jgi:hypothetical protein
MKINALNFLLLIGSLIVIGIGLYYLIKYIVDQNTKSQKSVKYSSIIDDNIDDYLIFTLYFPDGTKKSNNILFKIDNNDLSFNEILNLSESVYTLYPISDATTENDKKNRFINSFNQIFSKDGVAQTKINWDYFSQSDRAWNTYFTGHNLALKQASEASITNNINLLYQAYAMDAFACNFLIYMFYSGYIRTPKKELFGGTSNTQNWNSSVGNYLTKLMINEENKNGLLVSNNACYNTSSSIPCKVWKIYGNDISDPRNKNNRVFMYAAIQNSINEVWISYKQKSPINSNMYDYVPNYDLTKTIPGTENNLEIKTISGPVNSLGECNPGSCESELGSEWYLIGTENCSKGKKNICARNSSNEVPLFKYDGNKLWKRGKDNTMIPVTSDFYTLVEILQKNRT